MDERYSFSKGSERPATTKVTPLLRIDGNTRFEGWIISLRVEWVKAHWDGHRTIPHFTDRKLCTGCKQEMPTRAKGLVLVAHGQPKVLAFLELTPLAGERLEEQTAQYDTLRGVRIKVERERKTVRSPLVVTVLDRQQVGAHYPEYIDPTPTLARLWGCEEQMGLKPKI